MSSEKPTLCIALPSDTSARSLLSSGALTELTCRFQIVYICPEGLTFELPEGGRIDVAPRSSSLVRFADYYMWYLTYFKFYRRTKNLKDHSKSFKITMLVPKLRIALTLLSLPLLYEITTQILEHFVISYNKILYRTLKDLNPMTVILPGVPFDSFSLEVMKCSRRLSIKSIMAVLHWDFFSSKGLLRAEPDIICLWGKQMYETVISQHKVSPHKTRIIGSPQFEVYREKIERIDARKQLQLPLEKTLILFAGTGAPFDEMSILEKIDSFIAERESRDICVLYRPHPKKQPRKNERNFNDYGFKNIVLDPENASGRIQSGTTDLTYYRNLLYSIDGLISPFSTMIIEAALCGKPCLLIAFSDDLHAWKLEHALEYEHIQPLLSYQWITLCKHKKDLSLSMNALLETLDDSDIDKTIKNDINYIVYSDKNSYSKRLLNLVSEIAT